MKCVFYVTRKDGTRPGPKHRLRDLRCVRETLGLLRTELRRIRFGHAFLRSKRQQLAGNPIGESIGFRIDHLARHAGRDASDEDGLDDPR